MSNTYVIYSEINSLSEFGFIAGNPYTIEFEVFEQDGTTPLDMGGATFKWVLSKYGVNESVLEKDGSITGVGTAEVVLDTVDTESLSGKFIHQPVIVSFSGLEYRPAQGVLIIIPRTALN